MPRKRHFEKKWHAYGQMILVSQINVSLQLLGEVTVLMLWLVSVRTHFTLFESVCSFCAQYDQELADVGFEQDGL